MWVGLKNKLLQPDRPAPIYKTIIKTNRQNISHYTFHRFHKKIHENIRSTFGENSSVPRQLWYPVLKQLLSPPRQTRPQKNKNKKMEKKINYDNPHSLSHNPTINPHLLYLNSSFLVLNLFLSRLHDDDYEFFNLQN